VTGRPPPITPATAVDWETEFLDLILAVKVVDSLDEAVAHIEAHGTGHTKAILTRDLAAARAFVDRGDSSCVLAKACTRLNDGSELGLGAEIGIGTDKYHARGPCGLRELTIHQGGGLRQRPDSKLTPRIGRWIRPGTHPAAGRTSGPWQ
jgi:glutamate-5-semialdehyde dehydrogenase